MRDGGGETNPNDLGPLLAAIKQLINLAILVIGIIPIYTHTNPTKRKTSNQAISLFFFSLSNHPKQLFFFFFFARYGNKKKKKKEKKNRGEEEGWEREVGGGGGGKNLQSLQSPI